MPKKSKNGKSAKSKDSTIADILSLPIMGANEVAAYLGVSVATVNNWRTGKTPNGMRPLPAPAARLHMGYVWFTSDVVAYKEAVRPHDIFITLVVEEGKITEGDILVDGKAVAGSLDAWPAWSANDRDGAQIRSVYINGNRRIDLVEYEVKPEEKS